ncbi:MAG TPA: endonuclease MutS2 [Dehalococcoidia bacterium]|nr:endonuclease MutS2 [Dehalococcoidia bacterium]
MTPRHLQALEFEKVIARLEALCTFAPGRELARRLQPATDYREVLRRQRETAEARRLLALRPGLSLASARDVRELARQAAKGHVLQPAELLEVAGTLQLAQQVRGLVGSWRQQLPILAGLADRIADFGPLLQEIGRCLDRRGEVTDDASPVLGELRRQVRRAHDRLMARLERIVASQVGRQALQEHLVTMREGRYVLPVRAEMRHLLPGIVHDVSASGATVFVEPLEVVEEANRWRELQLEEQREVERVLRRLSALVGDRAAAIRRAVEALARLDLALAKARLGDELRCPLPLEGPEQPWLLAEPSRLRLVEARHPLLRGHVVPISLWLGREEGFTVLLITGPNTGGKTVALKTVGLLCLMAQAGLPVPADEGSVLPVFDGIYADIGDEQSIEQSLSTFSSHMGNIVDILRRATQRSLVLLDELGAGTDPTEGAALARAVLLHLRERGCLTVATTHHGELKALAHDTPGMMNASVEFDPETLAPTYHLRIGVPGHSNALHIAQRLGLPEEVLAEARRVLAPGHLEVERLLHDLQRERQQAAAERHALEEERRQAEALRQELERRLQALERERRLLLERTRRLLEEELAQARRRLQQAERAIERAQRSARGRRALEGARRLLGEVASQERTLAEEARPPAVPLAQVRPGDRVWLRGVTEPGEVLSGPDESGDLEVRLGALRARVPLADVLRVERPEVAREPGVGVPPPPTRAKDEIEVRGMTLDEALPLVEEHLDAAFRAGLRHLRIVHGKGSGTLRRAVRELLSSHPLVKSYRPAEPREGGEGVTVVEVAQ